MSETGARNIFILASFTLVAIDGLGATTTVYLSNRTAEAPLGLVYKPLLLSLNGLSYGMGAYTPQTNNGSITIDDSPHSFGFERRFSDLLERYTILDQEVLVSIERSSDLAEDIATPGTSYAIWRGQVVDWRRDSSAQRLTFRVKGFELPRTVFARTINAADFPSAPQASLGRTLPIIFGENIETIPICISADGSASPSYAVMTTLKDQFVSGGVQAFYAKDRTGTFRQFANAASTSAGVFAVGETAPITSLSTNSWERASYSVMGNGGIITNARIRCTGTGNAAWLGGDGSIAFRLYLPDARGFPGELIAEATREKIDFQTDFRGATTSRFWVEFTLSEPVVLGVGTAAGFFVGIADVTADNYATDDAIRVAASDPVSDSWRWDYSGSPGNKKWIRGVSVAGRQLIYDLFGVRFTETTSTGTDTAGLSYSKLDASQYTITGGYASSTSLTQLQLVVSTHGLRDVNGFIAGTNALITRPDHALRTVLSVFASNTWDNELVHPTAYSDTLTPLSTSTDRYFRKVGGKSSARQTAAQIVDDICRSCGIRVAQLSAAGLQRLMVFAWGTSRPSRAALTNRNSRVLQIESRDSSTVINRATAYSGETLRGLSVEANSSENGLKGYTSVAETYNGLDTAATALTSVSTALYGVRPNAATAYRFLGSSPRFASDYLCALFGRPHIYVTLETDLEAKTDKNDGLEIFKLPLLAVVEIIHPELPTYFGSSADPGPATFAGTATDPASGQYIVRATTYRGQIEGIEYIFNSNELPKVRFTVRLLTNYPNDPT